MLFAHANLLFGDELMVAEVKCPQCRKVVSWQDNPNRPFCSERCRLIDLGQWAEESYRIAGRTQDALTDENLIYLNDKKHKLERR